MDPIKKPLSQKKVKENVKANDGRLKVVVAVELGTLVECGNVEGLNDVMDDLILTRGTLSDINYRVVGHVEGGVGGSFLAGQVLIEVSAEVSSIDY